MNRIPKYRISLEESELRQLLTLLRASEKIPSEATIKLIKKVSLVIAKIDAGIQQPAYLAKSRQHILESITDDNPAKTAAIVTNTDPSTGEPIGEQVSAATFENIIPEPVEGESKEAYWLACYNKWVEHPDYCTLQEIKAAKEHMYLNDLMTPEQEAEFEAGSI